MADLLLCNTFLATPHRFLFHPPTATAILADLHLGIEADLNAGGIMMPDITTVPLAESWRALLARGPKHIVVAGDLFHSPMPAATAVPAARELLTSVPAGCRVTVLPGNHDPGLEALRKIFKDTPVEVETTAEVGGWTVAHGHELAKLPSPRGRLIVGHRHPAMILADRVQSAKMLCYAVVSDATGPAMIILPAFSAAPLGWNLRPPMGWNLDCAVPEASAVRIAGIVGDRVLDFGGLDRL